MLGYLARTLPTLVSAALSPAHRGDGPPISRIHRRVRPSEIDLNRHMNQAVYLQVMELGRTDWLLRSGAWRAWRASRITPIVAEQRIVYRRELRPFQAYTIETRAVAVEGRLLVVSHGVLGGDGGTGATVHAVNDVKLIFVGHDGVLGAEWAEEHTRSLMAKPLAVVDWRVV